MQTIHPDALAQAALRIAKAMRKRNHAETRNDYAGPAVHGAPASHTVGGATERLRAKLRETIRRTNPSWEAAEVEAECRRCWQRANQPHSRPEKAAGAPPANSAQASRRQQRKAVVAALKSRR